MTIEQAKKKIRTAWIIGLISGFITLFFTVAAAMNAGGTLTIQGTTLGLGVLLDVFLIFVLTFGIYMKSRVAAVGMFVYFLGSRLLMLADVPAIDTSTVISLLVAITILYFYAEGARGAVMYHRFRQGYSPDASPWS